jgi:excisionase family DNA binding protein
MNDEGTKEPEATSDLPPTLYSLREVARYLNVSRSTVRRLVETAQIPSMRVGGQLRFDILAVRAAIERVR